MAYGQNAPSCELLNLNRFHKYQDPVRKHAKYNHLFFFFIFQVLLVQLQRLQPVILWFSTAQRFTDLRM